MRKGSWAGEGKGLSVKAERSVRCSSSNRRRNGRIMHMLIRPMPLFAASPRPLPHRAHDDSNPCAFGLLLARLFDRIGGICRSIVVHLLVRSRLKPIDLRSIPTRGQRQAVDVRVHADGRGRGREESRPPRRRAVAQGSAWGRRRSLLSTPPLLPPARLHRPPPGLTISMGSSSTTCRSSSRTTSSSTAGTEAGCPDPMTWSG